jgi:hypothetical protein
MLDLACLCGQVRLALAARPAFIHECNCTLCRKTGARWAYYDPAQVGVTGETRGWIRSDKPEPAADVRFCPACGTATHFTLTEAAAAKHGNTVAGINMRLADERDLAGIELRYPDGRSWPGEGAFGYVREAKVIGE